ncbi:uncharacterized protein LOC144622336 isoform X2 [Crassostrea virginica]
MKTKLLAAEFNTEEFIRASKRPRLENEGTQPQGHFSGNLLMLAQTALSYCEDHSSEEEEDNSSEEEDNSSEEESRRGVEDRGTLMQTTGHMNRQTVPSREHPMTFLKRRPATTCKLTTEEDHSAKTFKTGNRKKQPCDISSSSCSTEAQGLQMLSQTAMSTSVSSEGSATTKLPSDHGDGAQPSRLELVLLGLQPCAKASLPHSDLDHDTPIDNSLPAKVGSSRRKSGVPRRRIPSESEQGTQASPEDKSPDSASRKMKRKRCDSRSYDYLDEPVPAKNVKLNADDSKADKAPVQTPYKPRPRQYLHPKLRPPQKAKNRAIDSKDAHKMKYPSHLHEWLERVKFSHTRRWQVFEYQEPEWSTEQLALTGSPGSSTVA